MAKPASRARRIGRVYWYSISIGRRLSKSSFIDGEYGVTARVVAEVYVSVALVVDPAGARLRRADEREPRGKLQARDLLLDVLLHADSVLDKDHERVVPDNWREKAFQKMVVDGLQADEHHVALRHVARVSVDGETVEVERPIARIDLQAVLLDERVVAVKQEVDVAPALRETRAVVSANATSSDYSVVQVLSSCL